MEGGGGRGRGWGDGGRGVVKLIEGMIEEGRGEGEGGGGGGRAGGGGGGGGLDKCCSLIELLCVTTISPPHLHVSCIFKTID